MLDKSENDLPVNAVLVLEFPRDPEKYKRETTESYDPFTYRSATDSNTVQVKSSILSKCKAHWNVSTEEVLHRLKSSLIPTGHFNFYDKHIQSKADLYGPFWISVSLSFVLAISSNLVDFFSTKSEDKLYWKYEFGIITNAFLIIFAYVWIMPIGLWLCGKWFRVLSLDVALVELICVYGYSLLPLIPGALLCIFGEGLYQLAVMSIAGGLSSVVLFSILTKLFTSRIHSRVTLALLLHGLFTLIVYLLFLKA